MASLNSVPEMLDVARSKAPELVENARVKGMELLGDLRTRWEEHAAPVNVGQPERVVSQIGGGLLLATGLRRGGMTGLMLAGLGGALLYRGLTGRCELYKALRRDTTH